MGKLLSITARVMSDYFTDSTGQTFAIGRGLAAIMFVLGLAFPMGVGIYTAIWAVPQPTMADWVSFLGALAVYYPALVAAVIALMLGGAPTDAGGNWWAKSNAQIGPGHQPEVGEEVPVPPPDKP